LKTNDNIDEIIKRFQNHILHLYNTACPLKRVNVRYFEETRINDKIRWLSLEKNKAYKLKNKVKYNCLRERLSNEIKCTKINFFKRKFSNLNSPKQLWNTIKKVTSPNILKADISLDTALTLNNKFGSIFEITNGLEVTWNDDTDVVDSSCTFQVNEEDVFILLSKIKSPSGGHDGIPGFIFREFAPYLYEYICKNCKLTFEVKC